MSLSSFLLPASKAKAKAIDKGLDDLFRASASAPTPYHSGSVATSFSDVAALNLEKKRKATEEVRGGKAKRSKAEVVTPSSSKATPRVLHAQHTDGERSSSEEGEDEVAEESVEEEEAEVEEDAGSSDSDDEGDPSNLVHESLLKGAEKKAQSRNGKAKYVPSEETPAQRDARTVFVGNVAIEVVKSRPSQKQFKRHILSFIPSAKIESVRFRSVAFKKPTAELPTGDQTKSKAQPKSKTREHDRDRAAAWRDKDEVEAAPAKRYQTPQEKKRVAFIKHELHEQVDAVNAYVVFAHPPSAEALAKRPANVPPPAPVMDPYEAAKVCAQKCDGSTFLGRTLRVDVVKKGAAPAAEEGGGAGTMEGAMAGDPKATVFVGNLEFTSKEEDLRAFFETLVCEERGKPGEKRGDESDDEEDDESESDDDDDDDGGAKDSSKPRTWVKRVRIIRDRDTQLGKGFAYVQFVDRECVDEILALDQSKLKFAKRKLRVQRCKTLPGGPKLRAAKPSRPSAASGSSKSSRSHPAAGGAKPAPAPRLVPASKHAPKGNPELGAKLAHLPKEERKKAKAADPDRVARRLAKKRAKALADKGVKPKVDRERVRKRPGEKKGTYGKESAKPRKRVRSGNALARMNTKK